MTKVFHGISVLEDNSGPKPVRVTSTSVIGIIGTAANANVTKWPENKPFLISKHPDEFKGNETLGDTGSLVTGLRAIFDTCPTFVVGIRVATEDDVAAAVPLFEKAGSIAKMVPKILCTNGHTKKVAAASKKNEPESKPDELEKLLSDEDVSNAEAVDTDNEESVNTEETESDSQATDPQPSQPVATSTMTADPVAQAFSNTAEKIRAIVVCDIPVGSSDSDTAGHTLANVDDFFTGISNKRIYPVWGSTLPVNPPAASKKSAPVSVSASAVVAATICKNDTERAWSRSPSNMPIKSILGVDYPVSFSLTDPTSEADQRNKKGVACIINYRGEFRLWGNCGLGIKTDTEWQFINIVRTYDIMLDSLLESSMWAMDRGIRSTYVDDVAISQNIFYSRLKKEGHITDAECIPGVEETTEDAVRAGDVFWKIKWCGVYPANRLNFTTKMETAYLKDIFSV